MITYTATSDGTGGGNTHLKPGYYPCRVQDAEEKRSTSGNDMIALKLQVGDAINGIETVYDNLVFTDKAFWKIDQFRHAIGEHVEAGQKAIVNTPQLIQRKCWVKTVEEDYQDKKTGEWKVKSKVDRYVRPDEVPDMEDAPAPRQQQTQRTAPVQQAAPPAPAQAPAPQVQTPVPLPNEQDDDIPF
ncbi:MAG: DUF669 domain-containing protein [Akkermansia sp.]|nr:DUF669 domain-containing protein [Akkermansia sp.]